MKLIDCIRKARNSGYIYIAIDLNSEIFAFDKKPFINGKYWDSSSNNTFLGTLSLQCDWRDTCIKLKDIKCV